MHDTCYFEANGLPCVAVLSDQFKPQARFQAQQLGAANTDRVFVQHPISDQTPAQLQAKAAAAFSSVCNSWTSATPIDPLAETMEKPKDCATGA